VSIRQLALPNARAELPARVRPMATFSAHTASPLPPSRAPAGSPASSRHVSIAANNVGPWPASLGCTTNSYSSINPSSVKASASLTPATKLRALPRRARGADLKIPHAGEKPDASSARQLQRTLARRRNELYDAPADRDVVRYALASSRVENQGLGVRAATSRSAVSIGSAVVSRFSSSS
jgi:hypothetical protein